MKIGSITDHRHQKAAYCGIVNFDTDAYPEEYRERLVMGNIHGGCINVDRLERDGSTYLAKAEPDLLTANDAWFMPVSQKIGPDGCLYILDWYDRYHCYQDANRDPAGIDRLKGRLYRVRYSDTPRAAAVRPGGGDRRAAHRAAGERQHLLPRDGAAAADRAARRPAKPTASHALRRCEKLVLDESRRRARRGCTRCGR